MKLKLLFLLLPFFIFSQNINWESKGELNTNNKYYFETSYDNFKNSLLGPGISKKGIDLELSTTSGSGVFSTSNVEREIERSETPPSRNDTTSLRALSG